MNKSVVFLIGLLVFAAAAAGLYYRLSNDPNTVSRYNWALEQVGIPNAFGPAPTDSEQTELAPESRSLQKREDRAERRRDRAEYRDRLELFKLGLDLANVLVGLIGIYLALTSMSARRHS
ncbi:MAG: hypothetical protein RIC14_13175 [Filomicrobium sp.]